MKRGEEGYILASAIGVLLAISIVAAALVSASANALARVRDTEIQAQEDAALQSAFVLAGAQLVLDPRRRQLQLDDASSIDVFGMSVGVRIRWESRKLDVNLASPEAIDAMLADQNVRQDIRDLVLPSVRGRNSRNEPIRLIADLGVDRGTESCLSSILTVFGGRSDYDKQAFGETVPVGQPAPGSRLSVDLTIADKSKGLTSVVLVTGDPLAPVRVLDWRKTSGSSEGDCRET